MKKFICALGLVIITTIQGDLKAGTVNEGFQCNVKLSTGESVTVVFAAPTGYGEFSAVVKRSLQPYQGEQIENIKSRFITGYGRHTVRYTDSKSIKLEGVFTDEDPATKWTLTLNLPGMGIKLVNAQARCVN